jgi:hypothetical protein
MPVWHYMAGAIIGILASELSRNLLLTASAPFSASWSLPVEISNLITAPLEKNLYFDKAVLFAYDEALRPVSGTAEVASSARQPFDLEKWTDKTGGGLSDLDRQMLGEVYFKAQSVFEYGLGESTYIANSVGVPRYAGLDSDAIWVASARNKVASHFRFYFGDIGPTVRWGNPLGFDKKNYTLNDKAVLDYCVAPLIVEPFPFDVYMVDGRFRMALVLLSFLHASARGGDTSFTTVLLHDFANVDEVHDNRPYYKQADHLLDMVRHSGGRLSAFRRKPNTTDAQLYAVYKDVRRDWR